MIIDFRNNCIRYVTENFVQKEHKPLSTKFSEVEILPDGRILIVEDYYQFHFENKSNLYCLNRNLEIDWFLSFPNPDFDQNDMYVGFTSNGERIYANSWACFRVEIDTNTGKLKNVDFTK